VTERARRGGTPRLVAVTPGDPRRPGTWSGINSRLCTALAERGALAAALNGRVLVVDYAEKAATFSPNRERWRQRHSLLASPLYPAARAATSLVVARRVAREDRGAEALLQVGARHDFSRHRSLVPPVLCSYHDANAALALRRPDLVLDRRSGHARRVLAYERRVYDELDLIFVMSEWARASFVEDFRQPPEKVVVVGAGANVDVLPEAVERDWSTPRLLFVGRHFERKGGPDLVAAFRRVRARRLDAELWVVGPPRPPLTAEPGVRFFGHLRRASSGGEAALERLYREATTFVMPSRYEPFGIAFLEAMANALPCVGTHACAMPEIIDDGSTGFVVPPGDVGALAERLLQLGQDGEAAAAMGEAGRRRLLARFTWDHVADAILAAVPSASRGSDAGARPARVPRRAPRRSGAS
jgi:starch synthase